jgi:hypothetical protein
VRGPDPPRGRAGPVAGRRGQHVTVPAVPAQPRHDAFLLALEPARPPLVFVGGRALGRHEEQHPVLAGQGHRSDGRPGRLHLFQRRRAGRHRHVEHIKNPAGDEHHVRLRPGFPPALDHVEVHRRLHLPGRRHGMGPGRGTAHPVTRAPPAWFHRAAGAPVRLHPDADRPAHGRVLCRRVAMRQVAFRRPAAYTAAPHHVDHRLLPFLLTGCCHQLAREIGIPQIPNETGYRCPTLSVTYRRA